ncbi:phage head closure protein [Paenibacillus gansuensis]|uniref:Phage head closure protein n=1 Tax=Paenibacillus gansuensis TaxID=306542 RepID=A0ABW5PI84_9BACL
MRFAELIQLIPLSYVSSGDVDSVQEGEYRSILAEMKSIRQSEYYQAIGNSIQPSATFVVWSDEYHKEPRLEHNGVLYEVIRTFETKSRTLELVCSAVNDIQTNLSELRDSVELWHYTLNQNSMGEDSPVPERVCTVPARIEYKGGSSNTADDVIETVNNLTVTIRYRAGITPDMYLMIDGNRHDIRFIEDPFNRHETLLLSVERVDS